ncbi:element excision factor XisH family protein [Oscillatoria sp. CS-180]|uniref:element excision factor XisH family protein n=1 Tax=Oscillatoria sp. CS-180 TaxID=3021720 RepID=UPI0023307268|nr:element excision factor XisH family protein [Oscillatoria sp. CS-180]MDB9524539.1 element excision factor XisH family protein [Oscillatoria sp. CS-180]
MAAKDIFHDAVKHALKKGGWTITHDPFFLSFGGVNMYVDLGAERIIAADRGDEKIAVEVKSFVGPSATTEFNFALGQFLKYQLALEEEHPERVLYLAVPVDAEREFFRLELPRRLIERYNVRLLIYDPEEEVIVKWQT